MAQTDRIAGYTGDIAMKLPCRVATTANTALAGLLTIDGVALAAGDRVLVKDQTTTTENGIYVAATGGWARSTDFDGTRDVTKGTQVAVTDGTVNAGYWFNVATAGVLTPGTSAITFETTIAGTSSAVAAAASAAAAAASETAAGLSEAAAATSETAAGLSAAAAAASAALAADAIAPTVHAATSKAAPVDADEFGIWDSVSGLLNKVTFANLWAWITSKISANGINGALGQTTPAAVAATTLSVSGQTSMLGKTAFLAALSAAQSNVTGDGTNYTIVCNTEIFDQASDYNNATGVFTAPVTGKFRLSFGMLIQGLTTSHTAVIGSLVTSNRTYPVYLPSGASGVTDFTGTFSALCDMDAGDTAYITIVAAGGTKVVDVLGTSGSSVYTTFSGEIVC